MAPVYIGLVHYPIYNKHMEVVTTALTNYDLHDIARTAKHMAYALISLSIPLKASGKWLSVS